MPGYFTENWNSAMVGMTRDVERTDPTILSSAAITEVASPTLNNMGLGTNQARVSMTEVNIDDGGDRVISTTAIAAEQVQPNKIEAPVVGSREALAIDDAQAVQEAALTQDLSSRVVTQTVRWRRNQLVKAIRDVVEGVTRDVAANVSDSVLDISGETDPANYRPDLADFLGVQRLAGEQSRLFAVAFPGKTVFGQLEALALDTNNTVNAIDIIRGASGVIIGYRYGGVAFYDIDRDITVADGANTDVLTPVFRVGAIQYAQKTTGYLPIETYRRPENSAGENVWYRRWFAAIGVAGYNYGGALLANDITQAPATLRAEASWTEKLIAANTREYRGLVVLRSRQ